MKSVRLNAALLFLLLGIGVMQAAPPTQVGDSFLSIEYGVEGPTDKLFYLAKDGTCKMLTDGSVTSTFTTYSPSITGTYSYVPVPGNPSQAALTLVLSDGTNDSDTLVFTSDTSGHFASLPASSSFGLWLALPNTFLSNVSNRVTLRAGDTAISGFVIEGSASRMVLIRAVGPTLANFGVNPVSTHPQMQLFAGTGTDSIALGQAWSLLAYPTLLQQYDAQAMGWIFDIVGAFRLNPSSTDQAYFGVLPPGTYTVQTTDSSVGASGGSALSEVYILPYSQ
jgi:hypothetical protein